MARIKTRTATDGTTRYTAEVRLKGYPAQTATFKRLTDAKKWIQNTESAIREGRHFQTVEAKRHTLADLVDRYVKEILPGKPKKARDKAHQLHWWKEKLGYCLLADITPALIVQCRDELSRGITRRGNQRAPATVFQYLMSISHAFTIAVNEWGWLDDSPMRKVKNPQLPRGRVRFLSDDERERLLIACRESVNPQLYICVVLALSTGMRKAELMSLEWTDLNLKDGYLILEETKNGQRRRVPLSGLGLELLKEHGKVRRLDTALLFPGLKDPKKPVGLQTSWETAKLRAGIDNFVWHDLRHSCASYLLMNGASLGEIGLILGHSSPAMSQRYSHLADSHVSDVIASMNQKIFGGAV
jgi:integrase